MTLEGCWGTTDEFAKIPFHLVLFSAALVELAKSIPVHSLSSYLFFCQPVLLLLFTVPCRIVFAKQEDLETWPNHLSFRYLTMVRYIINSDRLPLFSDAAAISTFSCRSACGSWLQSCPQLSWIVEDLPCFSEVRSFTSWYALLLLFLFRQVSISWHWAHIQFSFAFFTAFWIFLSASLYSFAPSASYRFFFKSLLSSQRLRTSLVTHGLFLWRSFPNISLAAAVTAVFWDSRSYEYIDIYFCSVWAIMRCLVWLSRSWMRRSFVRRPFLLSRRCTRSILMLSQSHNATPFSSVRAICDAYFCSVTAIKWRLF